MQPFTVWIMGVEHATFHPLPPEVIDEFLRLLHANVEMLGGAVVEIDHNADDAPFGPNDVVLIETSAGSTRIGYAAWKAGLSQATVAYGGLWLYSDYPSGHESACGPFPAWYKAITQKLIIHHYAMGVGVPGLRIRDWSTGGTRDDDGSAGYIIPRAVEQITALAQSRQNPQPRPPSASQE